MNTVMYILLPVSIQTESTNDNKMMCGPGYAVNDELELWVATPPRDLCTMYPLTVCP